MYQYHPKFHKLPSLRVVVLAVALLFHCASARATHTYQFQQTTAAGNELNGVVLATLELAALPASHEDVIGLTFTPAGQELLGYGATYEGSFDASYRQLIDNGSGLLVASGQTAWLSDSEAVVQHSDDEGFTSRFELIFPYFSGPYSDEGYAYFARYRYTYDPFFGTDDFEMSASDGPGGYWLAVPEPSSFGLLLLASVCLLGNPIGRKPSISVSRTSNGRVPSRCRRYCDEKGNAVTAASADIAPTGVSTALRYIYGLRRCLNWSTCCKRFCCSCLKSAT